MNLKFNQKGNIQCYLYRKCFLFLISSIIICSFSCQKKPNDPNEIAFSRKDVRQYNITAKKRMDEENILQPSNILYKNGLIALTESNSDTLIHILNADSLTHVKSKGVVGFGPNEIPSIWNLDSGPSDSTFWAYSLEGKIFNEYSFYNKNPLAVQQIKQSENFFLAVGITWASTKTLMTYLASGEDKYVEFDLKGNKISGYGKWKGMIPGGYPDHVIADIHQGKIRSNLVKNKIVKASILRDRIEILDRENGNIVGINGPLNVIPKFDIVGAIGQEGAVTSNDLIIAYTDLFLSKNFIFALYSGKSKQQLMKSGSGETEIFVFDYEGKVVALLKTDVPVSKITFDEIARRLFAITEEEDPSVALFDVPEFD